nr:RNA-dependent RNA polymerase [Armillaria RNA virus 1]
MIRAYSSSMKSPFGSVASRSLDPNTRLRMAATQLYAHELDHNSQQRILSHNSGAVKKIKKYLLTARTRTPTDVSHGVQVTYSPSTDELPSGGSCFLGSEGPCVQRSFSYADCFQFVAASNGGFLKNLGDNIQLSMLEGDVRTVQADQFSTHPAAGDVAFLTSTTDGEGKQRAPPLLGVPRSTSDLPTRGVDCERSDFATSRKYPLFSEQFESTHPTVCAAAYTLQKEKIIHTPSYNTIIQFYPTFINNVAIGKYSADDVFRLHICAFEGHMPDAAYRYIADTKPALLEDAREILAHINTKDYLPQRSYHGLHIYDPETRFGKKQGRRRATEYGTVSVADLLKLSSAASVLIRTTPTIAVALTGLPVPSPPPGRGNLEPGLYASRRLDLGGIPDYEVAVSLWAMQRYYLSCGYKSRAAKNYSKIATDDSAYSTKASLKLGMNEFVNPAGVRTKHRKKVFSGPTPTVGLHGKSAVPKWIEDNQTKIRARRTERLEAERYLDRYVIARYIANPTFQAANTLAKDRILQNRGTSDDFKVLYPYEDAELLARTRITWDLLPEIYNFLTDTYEDEELAILINRTGGVGLQGIAGIFLFSLSSHTNAATMLTLCKLGCFDKGLKHWTKLCKAIHNLVRRTQKVPEFMVEYGFPRELEAYDLMYIHLLAGRAQDELLGFDDYVAKRDHNPEPHTLVKNTRVSVTERKNYWTEQIRKTYRQYSEAVYDALSRHRDTTPQEFHANTISIAPRGSINQGKQDFADLEIPKHNLNKREWLNFMPTSYLWDVLKRPAEMMTNAQVKTETGLRLRQILPGAIYHWYVESQVMFYTENAVYRSSEEFSLESSPSSVLADHEETRLRTEKKEATLASDYADFNYLHTVEDMTTYWEDVFLKAAERLAGPGSWNGLNYPAHLVKCCTWLKSSLQRMYVREVGSDGRLKRVLTGLWSGWRTTSAINNSQNTAYDRALRNAYMEQMGYDPITKKRGNGDDVNAKIVSLADGLFYLRHMTLANLDVQASKQLVSRNCAEYLRIWYENGKIRGSLARSISSFISSDLQAPVISPGPDYVSGTSSALTMMARRGYDEEEIESLRLLICHYWSKISYRDPAGEQHTAELTDSLKLFAPRSQGGYGIRRYKQQKEIVLSSTKHWDNYNPKWDLKNVPHNGARAMFQEIYDRFKRLGVSTNSLPRLYTDIVSAMTHGVDTVGAAPETNHAAELDYKHLIWLNSVGRNIVDVPPLEKDYTASIACNYLDQFISYNGQINCTPIVFPQIEVVKARLVANALGLASITPNIIHDLFDERTGTKLTLLDMVRRDSEFTRAWGLLASFYPLEVINLFFKRNYTLKDQFYDCIPADYLIACQYGVAQAIHRSFHSTGQEDQDMAQLDAITALACRAIREHWLSKYSKIYQF